MNQAESWEDLLSLLRAERTTYQHLSNLLTQELDALRTICDQALLELAEKKKVVLEDLRFLDQRRVMLLARLLGPMPKNPTEWLPQLSRGPSPWGPQTSLEFKEVMKIARKVAEQGRQNAELTHRGVSMVREALRLIHSGGDVEPTYQGTGALRLPTFTSSLSVEG